MERTNVVTLKGNPLTLLGEYVKELGMGPNYDAALAALKTVI